jgi:CHAT domain-containing protein
MEAKSKQTCVGTGHPKELQAVPECDGPSDMRKALIAKSLREQSPLPNTADELCAMASTLHADSTDVYLGNRATVCAVSASGLDQYRIIAFATHGLIASESAALGATAESALVLTPPQNPSDKDYGLLTASMIAQLRLNADLVILSACNTATSVESGVEPLSGLARAFFYAGAHALVVAHWYTNDKAATFLIPRVIQKSPSTAGYSEALKESMLEMMTDPDWPKHEILGAGHPAVWAPFSLVGD